jgi:hypothetical protein
MIALTLLLACGAPKDEAPVDSADEGGADSSDLPDDSGVDSASDSGDSGLPTCGGTAPVVDGLRVENGGLRDFSGEEYPSAVVTIDMSDADGDLRPFQVDIWWDAVIDATVDTSTAEGLSLDPYIVEDKADCEVTGVAYALALPVDGGRFEFATDYEFAAVVTDAAGLVSDPGVGFGKMPNSDGTDANEEP